MGKDWCDEKDPTNKMALAFIREHIKDAQNVANDLDISVELLLGLSAQESGYGSSNIARNAKNYFGLNEHASGRVGTYETSKKVKVAKFTSFRASARSFATDFGKLVKGINTPKRFVDALIPTFNTTKPESNGNPKFKELVMDTISAVSNRMKCLTPPKASHKCGAKCKEFEKYGYCDRLTTKEHCWQHS